MAVRSRVEDGAHQVPAAAADVADPADAGEVVGGEDAGDRPCALAAIAALNTRPASGWCARYAQNPSGKTVRTPADPSARHVPWPRKRPVERQAEHAGRRRAGTAGGRSAAAARPANGGPYHPRTANTPCAARRRRTRLSASGWALTDRREVGDGARRLVQRVGDAEVGDDVQAARQAIAARDRCTVAKGLVSTTRTRPLVVPDPAADHCSTRTGLAFGAPVTILGVMPPHPKSKTVHSISVCIHVNTLLTGPATSLLRRQEPLVLPPFPRQPHLHLPAMAITARRAEKYVPRLRLLPDATQLVPF